MQSQYSNSKIFEITISSNTSINMWRRLDELIVLSVIIITCYSTKLEVQPDTGSQVALQQLKRIHEQAKHMSYGKCWTKALEQLQSGCRNLNDEIQRRIAYAFARCHLQSAGRGIPECQANQDVLECTSSSALTDAVFNTYTEFFTHTQQICFHLQSQVWHEITENTISKLADNSALVASTLEESSIIAQEMVAQQNLSLQNQEELLRNEQVLQENVRKSVLDVQQAHQETKSVIREQRELFAEVFNRVAVLQKTILGEFTSVYTFGFYIGASLLAYILTSTSHTSSARIWLFILITLNFVTERAVVNFHLAPDSNNRSMFIDSSVLPETVYKDIWICRRIYSVVALITMLVCFIRYKDYHTINNSLLKEIRKQNLELQKLLKEQGIVSLQSFHGSSTPEKLPVPKGNLNTPEDNQVAVHIESVLPVEVNHQSAVSVCNMAETLLGNNGSFCVPYDSDDDDTYVADSSSFDEASLSSNMTDCSRRSSLAPGDDISDIMQLPHSSTPRQGTKPSYLRGRRSSVSSNLSLLDRLQESVVYTEGVISGGHNLRKRKTNSYNNTNHKETVAEFIGAVARVTARQKRFLH